MVWLLWSPRESDLHSVDGRSSVSISPLTMVAGSPVSLDTPVEDVIGYFTSHRDAMPMARDMVVIDSHKLMPGILEAIDEMRLHCRRARVSLTTFALAHHGLLWLEKEVAAVVGAVERAKSATFKAKMIHLNSYLDRSIAVGDRWIDKRAAFRVSEEDVGRIKEVADTGGLPTHAMVQLALAWSLSTSYDLSAAMASHFGEEMIEFSRMISFQGMAAAWVMEQVSMVYTGVHH